MHSPFVFDFILHVLNNKKNYQPPGSIEVLRRSLLRDRTTIPVLEMGAGSRVGKGKERKVSEIARSALKSRKYGQLLFRLAKHYHCREILELGTSLGVTTAYLATADPDSHVTTIEGSPSIRQKAAEGFRSLGLNNIESAEGNFDEVLKGILESKKMVDLAYIDGNHKKNPTLTYFEEILKKTGDHSILVFDDIHWSREMEEAWEVIKLHPSVQYTIDIFFLGFVFFRKEFKVRQHFSIRFKEWL